MNRLRRLLHALRAFFLVTLSVAVISLALLVALARTLLPYADEARGTIEELVGRAVGAEVSIDHVDGHWRAFGPEFYIDGLEIRGGDDDRARFDRAALTIDLYGALLGRNALASVTVFGADISLMRNAEGEVRLGGLELGEGDAGGDYSWLLQRGQFKLTGSRLALSDEVSGVSLDLERVSLQLAEGRALSLSAQLPDENAATLIMNFHGDLLDTRGSDTRTHLAFQGVPASYAALISDQPWLAGWQGRLNGEFWLDTVDGSPLSAHARVELFPEDQTRSLSAKLRWRPTLQGWDILGRLGLSDERSSQDSVSWLQIRRKDEQLVAGLDYLDLERFLPMLRVGGNHLPEGWRLNTARFGGMLSQVRVNWEQGEQGEWQLRKAGARIDNLLAAAIEEGWPDIEGLAAQLSYANRTLGVNLQGEAALFGFSRLFAEPLYLGDLESRFRLSFADNGQWLASIDHFQAHLGGADLLVSARIESDSKALAFVDATMSLHGGDASRAAEVMPVGIMHPNLVAWLNEALKEGEISHAHGVLYGPLRDFPFRENQGRFAIEAQLTDGSLRYLPEWPNIESLAAHLSFVNAGMEILATGGQTAGIELADTRARIQDFRQPWLLVDALGKASGTAAQAFFHASPLPAMIGGLVNGMGLDADADIELALQVPLDQTLGELQVNGEVAIANGLFTMPALPWPLTDIETRVGFGIDHLDIELAHARVLEHPVEINFAVNGGQEQNFLRLAARGTMPVAELLGSLVPFDPLIERLNGTTAVELGLVAEPDGTTPRMIVTSDLAGVEVDLPSPLARQADDEPELLKVSWPLGDGGPLSVAWGERLRLLATAQEFLPAEIADVQGGVFPSMEWALRFGDQWPELSGQPGLGVSGNTHALDLDGWFDLAGISSARVGSSLLRTFSLKVDRLGMMRRQFADVDLDIERSERYWRVRLEAPAVSGELRLPAGVDSADVLVAQLTHLHWPSPDEDAAQWQLPEIDPDMPLPSLQILADEVRWGEYLLGAFRLEAHPDLDGYRVERLETRLDGTDIIGSGQWFRDERSESVFDFRLTANDLGQLLDDFGYANLVRGGQTRIRVQARWPGAPWDLALMALTANMQLEVGRGQIVEVEPGAGRVLGLLSLQALPRRLALDFSDFFGSGLTFDSIEGSFVFRDGSAFTDDLRISAPSADIAVLGETDLINRQYRQEVIVAPNMSSALPVVGALAGGPTGAAALWVLQEAFRGPMSTMAQASYSITGPWDSPAVELLQRIEPQVAPDDDPEDLTPATQVELPAKLLPPPDCVAESNEENECL